MVMTLVTFSLKKRIEASQRQEEEDAAPTPTLANYVYPDSEFDEPRERNTFELPPAGVDLPADDMPENLMSKYKEKFSNFWGSVRESKF